MGIEMAIGLIIGALLIWAGYLVQTKKVFAFLAGFRDTWEPVNKERLGNRVGILLIIIGVIAILASIFTIWFGDTVGKISGILAIIDVILIIIAIGLDQIGY
jgi:drug/metabolite transporter (DMT)-like permease